MQKNIHIHWMECCQWNESISRCEWSECDEWGVWSECDEVTELNVMLNSCLGDRVAVEGGHWFLWGFRYKV